MTDPAPRDEPETRLHGTLAQLRRSLPLAEQKLAKAKYASVDITGRVRPNLLKYVSEAESAVQALTRRLTDAAANYAAVRADFSRREKERQAADALDAEADRLEKDVQKLQVSLDNRRAALAEKRAEAKRLRKLADG